MSKGGVRFLACFAVLAAIVVSLVLTHGSKDVVNPVADEGVGMDDVSIGPGVPDYARALLLTYPGYLSRFEDGILYFADGDSLFCDDGEEKEFIERLDNTDIEDMFHDVYVPGPLFTPEYLQDPGRFRCEAFFKKIYGATEKEVRANLVSVRWFGQSLSFTKVNHAADSLKAVEREILESYPDLEKYFKQSSSFYWRPVRGANRLSAHSYGMTVDICVKHSDYWRWSNPGKEELDEITYQNRIPEDIIRVFERHGFISGAKWYHYDTMHFEFRPELLAYASLRLGGNKEAL